MTGDPHPKVRFQLLNTLGEVTTEAGLAARNRLLREDIADPWVQVAALLATPPDVPNLFESTLSDLASVESPERAGYVERISALIAVRQRGDDVQRLLHRLGAPPSREAAWWQAAGLRGLAVGLRRSDTPVPALESTQQRILELFFEAPTAELRSACLELLETTTLPSGPSSRDALKQAATLVADATAAPDRRADALRLLALADPAPYVDLIKQALSPSEHASVQQAAVRTLGRISGPEAGSYLISVWETLSPDIRDVAIDALMQSDARKRLLLDAIESRTIQPAAIGWGRTVWLMESDEIDLKSRARALLSEQAGVRQDILARYRTAATNPGDVARGRAVFTRVCSSCHQVQGTGGTAFGPDLGTVRHWSAPTLMTEILDPGRSLADGYELWTITRRDGGQMTGVIAAETQTSVTLREAGGKVTTIARTTIGTMRAANISAMPPGLEQQLSEQDMADLIAFLTQG
jgi:putative heme-binding domain-containing protein